VISDYDTWVLQQRANKRTDFSTEAAVVVALETLAECKEEVRHNFQHLQRWAEQAKAHPDFSYEEGRFYFMWGAILGYNCVFILTPPSGLDRLDQDAFWAGVKAGEHQYADENEVE
jgi:hypothetical protein